MARRNEDLFGRRFSIGGGFNPMSVMGTPLPEDDDSKVDAYSQIMSSQPIRLRSRTPVHLHPERNYGSQPRDFPANFAFLPTVRIPPSPRFIGQPHSNFYPPQFMPPLFNAAATDRPSTDQTEVPVRAKEVPSERQSNDRPVVPEEIVPPSTAEESDVQAIPRPKNAAGNKKQGQQASSSVAR
ncbi:hypothetical protein R1sor_027368 [Riccia sorocarpa]|uniref:Uncharacterized protein n=1 Tax=Riccia sorocarpa TaxID=122646 RepID=A0ABD3GH56_9MARC